MNDRGILASNLMSPLPKITNPENTTQFKLVKDSNSVRVNISLIQSSTPFTLYKNLLTFRDTGKEFELNGDLLKMVTNKNYIVDLAKLSGKNSMYDFAKEMYFDVKAHDNKTTWDRTLKKFLKSPGVTFYASGISNTKILLSDPDKLCNRLKFLLQELHAGNYSVIINDKIVVILDKLLEFKCISEKQHKQIFIKSNFLHTKKK